MPLHVAALYSQDKVVLALIKDFDCNPEVRGNSDRSLLHMACAKGNIHLVQTPIYNADINTRDYDNKTPFHAATLFGQAEVVTLLITEYGSEP